MTSKAKQLSEQDGKTFLQQAFAMQQQVLATQLRMSGASITHNGKMGEVNESYFIEIIRQYLPKRYSVDSGIVIDSNGKTSDQIDVIIYDHQFSPTLLDQQGHRFIPAESVYAVLEVKPEINKEYLEYAAKKAESVRALHRTSIEIHHPGGVFPAKKLFNIVAGIIALEVGWKDNLGAAFEKNFNDLTGLQQLDCGLALNDTCFDIYDNGSITFGPKPNALMYFLFRLLKKLQTLATVPAIDWDAYALQLSDK
jgi:hypothetical protein